MTCEWNNSKNRILHESIPFSVCHFFAGLRSWIKRDFMISIGIFFLILSTKPFSKHIKYRQYFNSINSHSAASTNWFARKNVINLLSHHKIQNMINFFRCCCWNFMRTLARSQCNGSGYRLCWILLSILFFSDALTHTHTHAH